jgi:hypothetical protein
MKTSQGGIFALGTASHAYLEFDLFDGQNGQALVTAISWLREPRTTMGGVNLVSVSGLNSGAKWRLRMHPPGSKDSIEVSSV